MVNLAASTLIASFILDGTSSGCNEGGLINGTFNGRGAPPPLISHANRADDYCWPLPPEWREGALVESDGSLIKYFLRDEVPEEEGNRLRLVYMAKDSIAGGVCAWWDYLVPSRAGAALTGALHASPFV
ncbi:hypothetical protein EVAR_23874_1 [Eumeta japonica]|uniref:Uncharacterized protein n=1 Tax=Eumeta variegata TaxID=151549 RepID=A0A4C1V3X6_EUMVA|nr:hypothetical protein EVAR_23874_1 [Eumeta japonica]